MEHPKNELPYLDEHAVVVSAAPARVWAALEEIAGSLGPRVVGGVKSGRYTAEEAASRHVPRQSA